MEGYRSNRSDKKDIYCLFPPLDIITVADSEQAAKVMKELFVLIWRKSPS